MLTQNEQCMEMLKQPYVSFAHTDLGNGVATIRTDGGIVYYDTWLRDEMGGGKIVGPHVPANNQAISVFVGHFAGIFAYEATNQKMAVDLIRRIAEGKPGLIKLVTTGEMPDAGKL